MGRVVAAGQCYVSKMIKDFIIFTRKKIMVGNARKDGLLPRPTTIIYVILMPQAQVRGEERLLLTTKLLHNMTLEIMNRVRLKRSSPMTLLPNR